ncbi:MAG TPA: PKD domain-containing protein [Myxococcota bacterium]|nr:PKD domain-containing protein [Myxococcota bacterium]
MRTTIPMALAAGLMLVACNKDNPDSGIVETNDAPTADAGEDQALYADQQVCLDGSKSHDPDGDALSYKWTFEWVPEGSAVNEDSFAPNNSPTAVTVCFSPDKVGTYVVALSVNDSKLWSATDFAVVEAMLPEDLPVADAGADQTTEVDTTLTLDGSASYDPLGKGLTYGWSLEQWPDKSALTDADITDATAETASFTPDERGVFVFNLLVCNDYSCGLADSTVVTVTGEDGAPTASAGEDITSYDCTHVALDGSGSVDPDDDELSFFWELQNKPAESAATNANFSARTDGDATFYGDVAGTYVLSLTVSDGNNWSIPDLITLVLEERLSNALPVVNFPTPDTIDAGLSCCSPSGYVFNCDDCTDQTLEIGTDVTVTDADSDPLTYQWELVTGNGTFTDDTSLVTFLKLEDAEATEPGVCDSNEYELKLTVSDCTGESTEATAIITVTCCGVSEDTGAYCEEEE